MYHISLYFDEKTNGIIRQHVKQVANKSGNDYMISGNVPPHITVAAFSGEKSEEVIDSLAGKLKELTRGKLTWVGVGTFLPHVIYISPVVNEYLDMVSKFVYNNLCAIKRESSCNNTSGLEISPKYVPFNWIPHTTIGKTLSSDEMRVAFEVMQGRFGVITGDVVKIGIAKTNPYENIAIFDLK